MTSANLRLALVLSEMAQVLGSTDSPQLRVHRALELMRAALPYDQCALLYSAQLAETQVYAYPELAAEEIGGVQARLQSLITMMSSVDERPPMIEQPAAAMTFASHLAVPLLALDDVTGVLFVGSRQEEAYDAEALSMLTVVSSQLANYLTMLRLLEVEERIGQELSRANDFQQLLVAIVSHDLRNPLGAIINGAGLLLRRAADERQARIAGRVISSARRASRIISDLLDVTHARVGKGIPILPKTVNVRELVQEAVDESRAASADRLIEFDDLSTGPLVEQWDADRMVQALGNLLSNAVSYSPPGTPARVVLRNDDHGAVIEVRNQGSPIPADALRHIFEPFKRGRQEGQNRGGLGLGLYIVDSTVRAHGGQVKVRSTDVEGTIFQILMPRTQPSAARDEE